MAEKNENKIDCVQDQSVPGAGGEGTRNGIGVSLATWQQPESPTIFGDRYVLPYGVGHMVDVARHMGHTTYGAHDIEGIRYTGHTTYRAHDIQGWHRPGNTCQQKQRVQQCFPPWYKMYEGYSQVGGAMVCVRV